MRAKFDVLFLEDAVDFIERLEEKARRKILYNISKSQFIQDPELFKKISGNVWEFRTLYNKTYYRIFAFWDKHEQVNILVIATHGIIKKTDKTPPKEIEKQNN